MGEESDEKSNEAVLVDEDDACVGEVLKEQPGDKRRPLSPSCLCRLVPPPVEGTDDIDVIVFGRRSKRQLAHIGNLT